MVTGALGATCPRSTGDIASDRAVGWGVLARTQSLWGQSETPPSVVVAVPLGVRIWFLVPASEPLGLRDSL